MKARAAGELAGEERRAPGIEIRLTGELHVERVEGLRGAEEQARGFAPAALGVRGLSAQQVQAGVLEWFELTGLGCGEQPTCHVERPRRQAGLGGGERPVGAPFGIARQRDRTLKERGRGGHAAARLRPARRLLKLECDLLVGPGRRRSEVPGPAIGIDGPIGHGRQRQMRASALRPARRPIHG